MPKLSSLMPDPVREKEGVWQRYSANIRVRIARLKNPAYQAAYRAAFHPHRAKIRRGDMPLEEILAIERRLHAEFIVRDWDGILDEETGEPLPYSVEKCFEYLSDARFWTFYEWILETAGEMDLYRTEERQEDLGNSSPASAGSSSGGSASTSSRPSSGQESA